MSIIFPETGPGIAPPRCFFTISHYREVVEDPTAAIGKSFIEYYCRLELTYPKESTKPAVSQVVLRRWSHFEIFDHEWAKIYPALHEQCHLPVKITFNSVFNKTKLADSRKLVLQQYIQKLLTINCLQDFVAQFMELDGSIFRSVDPKPIAAGLASPRGSAMFVPNTSGLATQRGSAVFIGSNENGEDGSNVNSNGVKIIANKGYVNEGPEIKGNTDKASRKAHRTKAKFEEANKELLAQILQAKASGVTPSIKLNLPFITGASSSSPINAASPSPEPSSTATSPMPMLGKSLSQTEPNSAGLNYSTSPMSPGGYLQPNSPSPALNGFTGSSPPPLSKLPPSHQAKLNVPTPTNGNGVTNSIAALQLNSPPPPLPVKKLKDSPPNRTVPPPPPAPVLSSSTSTPLTRAASPPPPSSVARPPERPKKRDWGSVVVQGTADAPASLLSPSSSTSPPMSATNSAKSPPPLPPPISSSPASVPPPPLRPVPAPTTTTTTTTMEMKENNNTLPFNKVTLKPIPFGATTATTVIASPKSPAPPIPSSKPSLLNLKKQATPPPPLPSTTTSPPPPPPSSVTTTSVAASTALWNKANDPNCASCKQPHGGQKFCGNCGAKL